jgi:hypothetical protein
VINNFKQVTNTTNFYSAYFNGDLIGRKNTSSYGIHHAILPKGRHGKGI